MQLKRVLVLFFCVGTFLLGAFLLYDNILILDDFHPVDDGTLEATGNTEATEEIARPSKGYHIHINLDNVTMFVYKDGGLIKTYPVSGGKSTTPTPLGTWKIISKDTWGEGFGGAWMGFNVPWGKYGIHGTVYPWVIGKSNSSKGCIRMLNKDVKELYRLVPHGTTVTIVHSNRKFRNLKSGDIGSDVKEVQKALKKLGYYNSYPDGKFGAVMQNSVKKFQRDNKLRVNGVVNKQTYNMIMQHQ